MPRGGRRNGAGRPAIEVAPDNPNNTERVLKTRVQEIVTKLNRLPLANATDAVKRFAYNRIGPNAKYLLNVVLPEDYTEAQINAASKITLKRLKKPAPRQLTSEEALKALLHLNLSKFQYKEFSKILHEAAGFSILPAYDAVRIAKAECRPTEGVEINEVGGSVEVQPLVLHTVKRILQIEDADLEERLQNLTGNVAATFEVSYGYDSSTSQKHYNQKFHNPENQGLDDSSLFTACMNPLLIRTTDKLEIWRNLSCQSPLFVRPFFIKFAKETPDLVREVKRSLDREISLIRPFQMQVRPDLTLTINVKFYETMIDGKVLNILTGTASNTCGICRASPSMLRQTALHMNTPAFKPTCEAYKKLGLGSLHAKIKFVVQIFKVAYYLLIFQMKIKDRDAARILKANRKKEIQDAFLKHGFRVDMPNQYGTGNTLNGPLCSELLFREDLLAEITGINKELIHRFRTILVCINQTKYLVKRRKFQQYCDDTTRLYLRDYGFYPLSPSVHKVLTHTVDVQDALGLPVGLLSEGAAEATHKRNKRNREFHTQKRSRLMSNKDLIQRAWEMSDPKLSWAHGKLTRQFLRVVKRRDLPPDVVELLKENDDSGDETNQDAPGPSKAKARKTQRSSVSQNANEAFELNQNPYFNEAGEEGEDGYIIVDSTEDSDEEFEYVYQD